MRSFIFILLLSLLSFSASAQVKSLSSQPKSVENEREFNYVVFTQNIQQLPAILMAAKELGTNERQMGRFELIIAGKALAEIKGDPKLEENLKMASELKINVVACKWSMKANEIDPEQFHEKIKVVDNGIEYNLALQKKGYLSLSL